MKRSWALAVYNPKIFDWLVVSDKLTQGDALMLCVISAHKFHAALFMVVRSGRYRTIDQVYGGRHA